MRFFGKTNIDFVGKMPFYAAISGILIISTIAILIMRKGPVLGIDFTGGTFIQIGFSGQAPGLDEIRSKLSEGGWTGYTLQSQPANNSVIIQIKTGEQSREDIGADIIRTLRTSFGDNVEPIPERIEYVGPTIGKKLVRDALFAIIGSLFVIVLYVTIRFKSWLWGFWGVVALAHDVIVTVGFLTFRNTEVNLVVIAALLMLAGYSINDTIVIFDRIRENIRSARRETMREIINRSINETLARTINTSTTTLLAAGCLMILGGEVIHDFAVTTVFGVIIGSYSTIAVSAFIAAIQDRKRA